MEWLKKLLGVPEVRSSSPQSPEKDSPSREDVERRLNRDFRSSIRFESYQWMEKGADPRDLFGKAQVEYPEMLEGAEAVVYRTKSGKGALRITIDIPTFDSFDRESDSWHTLYLYPGQQAGTADGIYCTGGYRLAYAVRCRRLLSAPPVLWQLLKVHKVLPGNGEQRIPHKPGERLMREIPETGQELWFEVDETGKSLWVTDGGKAKGDLVIPDTVDGLPVVGIKSNAFRFSKELQRVELPQTVRTIGSGAFSFCGGLKEISLGSGLREIEGEAFRGCLLLEEIYLPESVEKIGSCAFEECKSLKALRLPKNVRELGTPYQQDGIFPGCTNLEVVETTPGCLGCMSINSVLFSSDGKTLLQYPAGKKTETYQIPEAVETIGSRAFAGAAFLREIRLSESTKFIREKAFENCTALETIRIGAGVQNLNAKKFFGCGRLLKIQVTQDNPWIMDREGVLFDKAGQELLCFPKGDARTSYCVPDTVRKIGAGAFAGCRNLREVLLPEGLETIAERGFENCSSLEVVSLPGNLREIGESAFEKCESLEEITLPEGLQELKRSTFLGCSRLQAVHFPKSLKSIGRYGFADCSSLKKTELPERLEDIGCYAFSGCNLSRIVLPNSIRYIEEMAFEDCGLSCVTYLGTKEEWGRKVDLHEDAWHGSGCSNFRFLE